MAGAIRQLQQGGDIYTHTESALYGKKSLIVATIVFWGLMALFLYQVGAKFIVYFCLLSIHIIIFCKKTTLEINTDKKLYRKFNSLFGLYYARWKPLPDIEYINVKRAIYTKQINFKHFAPVYSQTDKLYEVNFILSENYIFNVWTGATEETAFNTAIMLGARLNIKILDATQKPFVWVE